MSWWAVGSAAVSVVGMISSSNAASSQAAAQQAALTAQANLDRSTAAANASAVTASAGIDQINALSGLTAANASADLGTVDATSQHDFNASQIQLGLVGANSDFYTSVFKADTTLNAATIGHSNQITNIGLSLDNATANYDANVFGAKMDVVSGDQKALAMTTSAAVDAIHADSQILALQVGAQISGNAAKLDELQAQTALFQGGVAEQNAELQGAQAKSHQIASFGHRGIDMGEGSTLGVLNSTDFITARAVIDIQQRTMLAAFGYRDQEESALLDQASKTTQADATQTASTLETGLTTAQVNNLTANVSAAAQLRTTLASIGLHVATVTADSATKVSDAAFTMAKGQWGIDVTNAATTLGVAQASAAAKTVFNDSGEKMSYVQFDTQRALALAGYNNQMSAAALKTAMAAVNLTNANAAADVKASGAANIDPNAVWNNSMLNGSAKIANTVYGYGKANGWFTMGSNSGSSAGFPTDSGGNLVFD